MGMANGGALPVIIAANQADRGGAVSTTKAPIAVEPMPHDSPCKNRDAQLREFQCGELCFYAGQFGRKQRIIQEGAVTRLGIGRIRFDARKVDFRSTDACDTGTLVAQQELCIAPTLVFFTNEVLNWHFDVVEEYLINLITAVNKFDGLCAAVAWKRQRNGEPRDFAEPSVTTRYHTLPTPSGYAIRR